MRSGISVFMLILLLPLFVGVNAEDPEISTVSAQPVSSTS